LLLPQLRAQFDVPFVGVVPAIKPAAKYSVTKRIGLLATPATVTRTYTDELIGEYAGNCEVIRVGSNELVLQAEALLSGKSVSLDGI
jgi:glutamate racemase